ncbi:hypothetical protein ABW19_dt0208053 [Dactylella cylindrospora]|nr:hypothetical protein ABW19_dt0208053 [Dactylella cylindrospora]
MFNAVNPVDVDDPRRKAIYVTCSLLKVGTEMQSLVPAISQAIEEGRVTKSDIYYWFLCLDEREQFRLTLTGSEQEGLFLMHMVAQIPEVKGFLSDPSFLKLALWSSGLRILGLALKDCSSHSLPLVAAALVYRRSAQAATRMLLNSGVNADEKLSWDNFMGLCHYRNIQDECLTAKHRFLQDSRLNKGLKFRTHFAKAVISEFFSDQCIELSSLEIALILGKSEEAKIIWGNSKERAIPYDKLQLLAICISEGDVDCENAIENMSQIASPLQIKQWLSAEYLSAAPALLAALIIRNYGTLIAEYASGISGSGAVSKAVEFLLKHFPEEVKNELNCQTLVTIQENFYLEPRTKHALVLSYIRSSERRAASGAWDPWLFKLLAFGGVDAGYRLRTVTSLLKYAEQSGQHLSPTLQRCAARETFDLLTSLGCCFEKMDMRNDLVCGILSHRDILISLEDTEKTLLSHGGDQIQLLGRYKICNHNSNSEREDDKCIYLSRVRSLIKDGFNVNDPSEAGERILHNHLLYSPEALPVLQGLVSLGVRLTEFKYPKPTPVLLAVTYAGRKISTLEYILDNGGEQIINVAGQIFENFSSEPFMTPLGYAAKDGNFPVIVLLLTRGADVDYRPPNGLSPLEWATLHGKLDTVKLLLNAGSTRAREALALTPENYPYIGYLLEDYINSTSVVDVERELDPDDDG